MSCILKPWQLHNETHCCRFMTNINSSVLCFITCYIHTHAHTLASSLCNKSINRLFIKIWTWASFQKTLFGSLFVSTAEKRNHLHPLKNVTAPPSAFDWQVIWQEYSTETTQRLEQSTIEMSQWSVWSTDLRYLSNYITSHFVVVFHCNWKENFIHL